MLAADTTSPQICAPSPQTGTLSPQNRPLSPTARVGEAANGAEEAADTAGNGTDKLGEAAGRTDEVDILEVRGELAIIGLRTRPKAWLEALRRGSTTMETNKQGEIPAPYATAIYSSRTSMNRLLSGPMPIRSGSWKPQIDSDEQRKKAGLQKRVSLNLPPLRQRIVSIPKATGKRKSTDLITKLTAQRKSVSKAEPTIRLTSGEDNKEAPRKKIDVAVSGNSGAALPEAADAQNSKAESGVFKDAEVIKEPFTEVEPAGKAEKAVPIKSEKAGTKAAVDIEENNKLDVGEKTITAIEAAVKAEQPLQEEAKEDQSGIEGFIVEKPVVEVEAAVKAEQPLQEEAKEDQSGIEGLIVEKPVVEAKEIVISEKNEEDELLQAAAKKAKKEKDKKTAKTQIAGTTDVTCESETEAVKKKKKKKLKKKLDSEEEEQEELDETKPKKKVLRIKLDEEDEKPAKKEKKTKKKKGEQQEGEAQPKGKKKTTKATAASSLDDKKKGPPDEAKLKNEKKKTAKEAPTEKSAAKPKKVEPPPKNAVKKEMPAASKQTTTTKAAQPAATPPQKKTGISEQPQRQGKDQPRTVVISSSASVSSLDMGDNKKQAIDILPLIPPKRAGSKQKSEMRPEPEEIYKLLRSYSEYYPLARFIDEKEQQEQENIGLQKGIKTDIHFFQKHKLRPGYPLTPLGPDQSRTVTQRLPSEKRPAVGLLPPTTQKVKESKKGNVDDSATGRLMPNIPVLKLGSFRRQSVPPVKRGTDKRISTVLAPLASRNVMGRYGQTKAHHAQPKRPPAIEFIDESSIKPAEPQSSSSGELGSPDDIPVAAPPQLQFQIPIPNPVPEKTIERIPVTNPSDMAIPFSALNSTLPDQSSEFVSKAELEQIAKQDTREETGGLRKLFDETGDAFIPVGMANKNYRTPASQNEPHSENLLTRFFNDIRNAASDCCKGNFETFPTD